MKLIHNNSAELKVVGRSPTTDFMLSTFSDGEYVVSGAPVQSNDLDAVINTYPPSTAISKYRFNKFLPNFEQITIENLTPSIISVSDSGIVGLSHGIGKLRVSSHYGSKIYNFPIVERINQDSYVELIDFAPSSLMRHINDSILSLTSGLTPSTENQRVLTSPSSYLTSIERNPSLYLLRNGLDISGLMFGWDSNGSGGTRSGYIVSPNHFITATHFRPTEFKVIDSLGVVHHRSSITYTLIPNCDLAVGYFSQALPASVKPAKILPSDFNSTKIKSTFAASTRNGYSYAIPCVNLLHTNSLASIGECHLMNTFLDNNSILSRGWNANIRAKVGLSTWWKWNGGSSSPVVTIIDNEPILLFCLYYGSSPHLYGGPLVSRYITEVNAAMASLQGGGSPHQLIIKDLSAYPSY